MSKKLKEGDEMNHKYDAEDINGYRAYLGMAPSGKITEEDLEDGSVL